jgi:hypothetical protein
MTQAQPGAAVLTIKPTALKTIEEAKQAATFPLEIPSEIPPAFQLESVKHFWPDVITAQQRQQKSVRADFVQIRYTGPGGAWLEIHQGYFSRFVSWTSMAPASKKGSLSIGSKQATWTQGRPRILRFGPTGPVTDWTNDSLTAISWEEGVDADSHRSVAVASEKLTLTELTSIAQSI